MLLSVHLCCCCHDLISYSKWKYQEHKCWSDHNHLHLDQTFLSKIFPHCCHYWKINKNVIEDFKRMETDKDKIRVIESVTNGINTTKNIS